MSLEPAEPGAGLPLSLLPPSARSSSLLPPLLEPTGFASLLSSSRSAFRWKTLIPVWLWLTAAAALLRAFPGPAGAIGAAAVLAASGLIVWGMVAFHAAREVSLGAPPLLLDLLRAVTPAAGNILLTPVATLMTPAFFLALALAGALVGRVPIAGDWLGPIWVCTGGLLLSLLGAAWAAAGLVALPFQVTAAVVEADSSRMEIVCRTLSLVRRHPLRVAQGWLVILAGSALGTAAFLIFLSMAGSGLLAAWSVSRGETPAPGQTLGAFWGLLLLPETWIPLLPETAATGTGGAAGSALVLLGRFAPAFLIASLLAGGARLYLLIRAESEPAGGPR